ncbi:hypothetical protein OH77DRAFT_748301 [Trametes cingulata]|nr:hypothetical protein OH77DRAFT_748301 [Trametes cingulata]
MNTPRASSIAAASPEQPGEHTCEDQPPAAMYPFNARTDNNKHERSPVRTILVFSAVVGPLAFLPYLFVRRRLVNMHEQLANLRSTSVGLTKEQRYLRSQLEGGLEDVRRHVTTVASREGKKVGILFTELAKTAEERDERRRAWEEELRNNLKALQRDDLARRFAAELKDLGQSLADTAAFIQEVEVRQGWTPLPEDGRGIERTRHLAKRLQELGASLDEKEERKPPSPDATPAEPGSTETGTQS